MDGNPVNLVDPSGMVATLPQALSSGMCDLSLASLLNGLWSCEGAGCQDWLDDAYSLLQNTGGYYSSAAANLMNQLSRQNIPAVTVSFTQNTPGGTAALPYLLTVDRNYLADTRCTGSAGNCSSFADHVGVVLHELWHTTQGIHRFSTKGEIDAYIFQVKVLRDFGFSNRFGSFFNAVETFGVPGNVTNDICQLCRARTCLMDYAYAIGGASGAYQVYASEPLTYSTIELGSWSPLRSTPPLFVIWPVVCSLCADTSCPS